MARALHVPPDDDAEVVSAALREEAQRLGRDSADRKELVAIAEDLDALAPAWPDA